MSREKDGLAVSETSTQFDHRFETHSKENIHGNSPVPGQTATTYSVRERIKKALGKGVPLYLWCTLLVSVGGFHFGYDTGSIGPITIMPQFRADFPSVSPTVQGLIVSSILITASLASLAAGIISDQISRTFTISLGGGVFATGSAICCASNSLAPLFVGRCISGIGQGLFLSAITVYVCEISPAALRGRLSCITQLFVCIGIAVGFFVCFGTVKFNGSIAWRFPFGMQAVVAFLLCITAPLLPHSPRWLKYVGREEQANKAWSRLGFSSSERELEEADVVMLRQQVHDRPSENNSSTSRSNWLNKVKQLFSKDVRMRTLLGWYLNGMQQACGIDGVLYYAPILFSQAGLHDSTASFLASAISGVLLVISTGLTQFFVDRWGRRPIMIYGGTIITTTMLILGILYASKTTESIAGKWAAIVLIYIFIVAFAMSWGVTIRIFSSEIQPMHTRAAASSIGQCVNWGVNWIIAFSTPLFLSRSPSGPYFLFGGCALSAVLVCIAFQPETKGVRLEDLDALFEVSPWEKMLRKK